MNWQPPSWNVFDIAIPAVIVLAIMVGFFVWTWLTRKDN